MKKIMNGKVKNTANMEKVSGRTTHYSPGNNSIGWQSIYADGDAYYLETIGGNDIYAPDDDLELIADDVHELIEWVEGTDWATDCDVIEWVEEKLK